MKRRKKQTGRLLLRGNVWYGRYRTNGKEVTFSTGIENTPGSRAEAEKVLMDRTEVLRIKNKVMQIAALRAMLESAEDEYRRRVERSNEKTLKDLNELFSRSSFLGECSAGQMTRYIRYIKAVQDTFGMDTPLSSIGGNEVDSFLRKLARSNRANTYNKYLNGLARIWTIVGKTVDGLVNPWKDAPRKKKADTSRRRLTDDECTRILASADGDLKKVIAIGLFTGLRLSDAMHLKWDDFKGNVIDTITGKTKQRVIIPISKALIEHLGERKETGLVIPSMRNSRNDGVSRMAVRLFAKCGIETSVDDGGTMRKSPRCTFHSLRHTFVSRLMDNGVPIHVVRQIVGHSNSKMTEHYTHADINGMAAWADKIG